MKKTTVSNAMNHLNDEMIADAAYAPAVKKKGYMRFMALAASFAILCGTMLGVTLHMIRTYRVESVVALDVNPSIQIEVNAKDRVIKAEALNKDGQIVLGDMDLDNVKLDVAMNAIVGSMWEHEYLSEQKNSVLISVNARDEGKGEALQASLSEDVGKFFVSKNVEASIYVQSFDKTEGSGDVSAAKEAFVHKIVASGVVDRNGVKYTYEELIELNINELKALLEAKHAELEGVLKTGHAALAGYFSKEEVRSIALEHAGIALENARNFEFEFDCEKGRFVYEVEFVSDVYKYEYEIDAQTGDIVDSKKELADKEDLKEKDPSAVPEGILTVDEIMVYVEKLIAFLGTGEVDIRCELDQEDGIFVYEVEFRLGNFEYSYELNAKNGDLIKSEKEWVWKD